MQQNTHKCFEFFVVFQMLYILYAAIREGAPFTEHVIVLDKGITCSLNQNSTFLHTEGYFTRHL